MVAGSNPAGRIAVENIELKSEPAAWVAGLREAGTRAVGRARLAGVTGPSYNAWRFAVDSWANR